MARIDPGFGLLIPDPRLVESNQEAVGVATTSSAYTQAGPQPGTPEGDAGSPWRPQLQGAQSVDIEVITAKGGYAGLDGARVLYREPGETADETRGWDEMNCLTQFTAPSAGWSTVSYTIGAICAIPPTGNIVVYVAGSSDRKLFGYNPRTETWSALFDFTANSIPLESEWVDLVWDDQNERLLLFAGDGTGGFALFSEDYGSTWSPYSQGYWSASYSSGRLSIATSDGAWVAFTRGDGTDTVTQWVSTDQGVSWEEVASGTLINSAYGPNFEVIALPRGGFLIIYMADGGTSTYSRRLGAAGSSFVEAEEVWISGLNGMPTAWVDDDGTVYALAVDVTGANFRSAYSTDDGASWQFCQYQTIEGNGALGGSPGEPILRSAASCGQGFVLMLEFSSLWHSSVAAPFGLLVFGGWSTVEGGAFGSRHGQRYSRIGWGNHTDASGTTALATGWLPVALPETGVNPSWSKVGTGNVDLSQGPFGQIATSASQLYYECTWSAQQVNCGHFHVQQVSGGSNGNNDIAAIARLADGAYDFRLAIRVAAASLTAYDVHGATGTTASVDTTGGVYVRWMTSTASGGTAFAVVWYRLAGTTQWTELVNTLSLTDGGASAADDGFAWGGISASGTATSNWSIIGVAGAGQWHSGARTAAQVASVFPFTVGGPLGLMYGHTVPPRGVAAYPIPDATGASEEIGRIAASGGPTYISESVTLPTGYEYPATAIYPATSPSPSRYWQSTNTTEAKWVWDLGARTWMGDAVGVAVYGAQARQWALEYSDAGSTWTTAGTLDLALGTGLSYTRSGDTIYPRSGTTDVTRYVPEGSLVGGYAVLTTGGGGGTAAFRIAANSGGYWTDDSGVQALRIRLEGDTSSTDTSSTCAIVCPSGVLVAYPTGIATPRYWRVRAPASQVTPGSVYRAGVVVAGRVVGLGAEPGWDYSRRLELSRRVERRRDGTPIIEELAKPRQVWTYGWTDGLVLRELRGKANGGDWADYVATSSGLPIGSEEDAHHTLWGLIEHALASGSTPCVLLPSLPSSTASITDPTLHHYGVLVSDASGITGVVGQEGESEIVRLDAAAFEGIR